MGGKGENAVNQAEQGGGEALPPVGAKTAAEVADPVMVKNASVGEEQESMFRWVDLDLLVRGFEVEARAEEGARWIGGAVGQLKVEGKWHRHTFGERTTFVDLADGAIEYEAGLLPLDENNVQLADGDPGGPGMFGGGGGMAGADHPASLHLLVNKALHDFWVVLCLLPVALAEGEVEAGVGLGVGDWSPLMAGWQGGNGASRHAAAEKLKEVVVMIR